MAPRTGLGAHKVMTATFTVATIVAPGAAVVLPGGSVLFKIGPDGSRIPIRRFF